MDIEVANKDDDGIAVSHVCSFIPPLAEPALDVRIGCSGFEAFLELCGQRRRKKVADCGLCALERVVGNVRAHGFEVFGSS